MSVSMSMNKSKQVVLGGLLTALVFVATFSIKIPIPFTGGYIHAGDSMIFLAALLFGWRYGALAGGIGACLADILGGYVIWGLPTLVIKFVMGALVGWAAHSLGQEASGSRKMVFAVGVSAIWLAFMAGIKVLLGRALAGSHEMLMAATETASVTEALDLAAKVNSQLLLVTVAMPLILVVLALVGQKLSKSQLSLMQIIAMMAAGLWMVMGYYVAGSLLVGNWLAPIFSIVWNIVQFVIGLVIAYLLYMPLQKMQLFS